MVFNKHVRLQQLVVDPLGIVAIQAWTDGHQPIGLVGVYNPPAQSVYNVKAAPDQAWSARILSNLVAMVPSFRERCEKVIVLGDFNERLGSYRGRRTEDSEATPGGRVPGLCNTLHMEPIHGRLGESQAVLTSRPVNKRPGGAEVDYILVDWDLQRERATPLPSFAWKDEGSHRPIAAVITLTKRTIPQEPSPGAAPKLPRYPVPAYPDRSWYDASGAMMDAIARVRSSTRDPTDVDRLYDDIVEVITATLAAVKEPGLRRGGGQARPWQGPPPTPQLLELYNRLHETNRALRKRKNKTPLPPSQREQLEQQRKTIKTSIRKAKARQHQRHIQRIADLIHSCRPGDPHMMHKIMEAVIGGDKPRATTIEHPREFLEFFCDLFKEKRPTPPALTKPERLAEIPVATLDTGEDGLLTRPITPHEVYYAILPMHASAVGTQVRCHPHCVYCKNVRDQSHAHIKDPRSIPVPQVKPHLNTARACGPDGIPASVLRFWRNVESNRRMEERWILCGLLAQWASACLSTGRVPTGHHFSGHLTSLLLKPGTPDFPSDPQNPNDYRAITVGNTGEKLLEAIIYRRLMHWAVLNGLIPETQAGFMEHMGAEHHVYSLLETIKNEWRQGRKCFAVFVDFKKAYDNIHLEALWAVLEHMGVPAKLLTLLKCWASSRTTFIRAGDLWSEETATDKGTPQGSVLSPLLFNLFIASLHRCLRNLSGWEGLKFQGRDGEYITVKDLFYADDLVALAASRQQAQLVLTAIYQWAADWGLELGIGKDKTAAMVFDPSAESAITDLPPLMAGEQTIPWVARYKYLGYILRFDLSNDSIYDPTDKSKVILEGMADRLRKKLDRLSERYFARNRVMQRLPLATQFQFLGSVVQAALSYLFSVIPLSAKDLDDLDAGMNQLIRDILGLTKTTPRIVLQAESRIASWHVVQLTHRLRLQQYFKHNPFPNSIASRIFRITSSMTTSGCPERLKPWAKLTEEMVAKHTLQARTWGCELQAEAASYFDIHRTCVTFSRNVGHVLWASEAMHKVAQRPHDGTESSRASREYSPPTDGRMRSRYGVIAAADAYRIHPSRIPNLGKLADSTPLSLVGPGSSGALICLATIRPKYSTPALRARIGTLAVALWPFGIPTQRLQPKSRLKARERRQQAAKNVAEANRRAVKGCEHCGSESPEDVWHVLLECTAPRYRAARQEMIASAPGLVCTIARRILEGIKGYACTYGAMPTIQTPDATAACESLQEDAAKPHDWASKVGHFLLFRLLTVLPFGPTDVPRLRECRNSSTEKLSRDLGQLLENTRLPRRFLRQLSNDWIRWSFKWLKRFGDIRCDTRSQLE